MAGRHIAIGHLEPYILDGVTASDQQLGFGSFSNVVELDYKGLKCVGKRLPEMLFGGFGAPNIAQKFVEECHLHSLMRHPNIIQFLGVHFERSDQRVPMLVTEFLPTDLSSCIYRYGVLPKEINYSILHDVSLGMNYLHNLTPPIMHRDLTSVNVRLASNMTAKISDLGMAKLESMPHAPSRPMTPIPGSPVFMAPETMAADPKYGITLDVFSYGIIMIHVFSGEWPYPKSDPVRPGPDGRGLVPVSEAQRREEYLRVIADNHPLKSLILRCINNDPKERGNAAEIVQRLKDTVQKFPLSFANRVEMLSRIEALEEEKRGLVAEIERKDGILRQLNDKFEELTPVTATQSPRSLVPAIESEASEFRGVEVCADTKVTVTSSSQHFHWIGYGFSLHIPDGCLPLGVDQCTLNISVSLAGQYEFPEDSHLVSAVYWLRCEPSCKFTKAISVEIEHCAPRGNAARLSIVRSHCTQKQPLPYSFKKLGGVFTEHSSYGYIELNSFSGAAVVQDGSEEREYCAGLYYLEKTRLNPEIHFVVVWDTPPHLKALRKHYKSAGAVKGPYVVVTFESDYISLGNVGIPPKGIIAEGGWQIVPVTPLKVSKRKVDNFKPERSIPYVQLQAYCPKIFDPDKLLVLTHPVQLEGAREPYNSLTISFIPSSKEGGNKLHHAGLNRKPLLQDLLKELMSKVADKWENIGICLGIESGQLDSVKASERNAQSCLREMLKLWLHSVSPPPTWPAVIDVIQHVGHADLALELRVKYCL